MEQVIIYGAGNTGKGAYYLLKTKYECLFFVDSDSSKWGEKIDGLEIQSPTILKDIKDVTVIIASIFWREIAESLSKYNLSRVCIFRSSVDCVLTEDIKKELNKRTIELGAFIKAERELFCKELTFMPGGSGVLDYAFLKILAERFRCKTYLEIGTYIGESINVLTDCCEKLYSITAPMESWYSMREWCRAAEIPDYSERLTYSDKITHFFSDSKEFDYNQIDKVIDLYFIDGDHSYSGVYADTKNIFERKKEDAIVVWHDFRKGGFTYNEDVICAVKDVLGSAFQNVYVTDRNMCGVYLPEKIQKNFILKEMKYEENAELYTYDVVLKNCRIR